MTLYWQRLKFGLLILAMMAIYVPVWAYTYGGLADQKTIAITGVANSNLVISNGTPSQFDIVIGVPGTLAVTSGTATNYLAGSTATLHGTLTAINGIPTATTGFEWGYAPGSLTNTSSTLNMAVGVYSIGISGIIPNQVVYYRSFATTNETAYGAVNNFYVSSAASAGFNTLNLIMPLLLAAGCFLIILRLLFSDAHPIIVLVGVTVLTAIGIAGITSVVNTLAAWLGG
jgi:hypothetical protein